MSTKRTTQTIVDVEVKAPSNIVNTQTIVEAEVHFLAVRTVSQVIVGVEVLVGPYLRIEGSATQCT